MRIYVFCFLVTLKAYSFSANILIPNQKNYGPYVAKWTQYEICRGPKSRNLTNLKTKLFVEGNTYRVAMNFTFLIAARIDEVKIAVYSNNGDAKNLLWNYKVDNPCQHYALGSLLRELGAQNCIFKKGNYHVVINLTESTYQFFGQTFFYGNFLFKIHILCKSGNIGCINIHTIFSKK